nr:TetR/AcrR family transcriptional regulator [Pulveribacter suum]
MRRRPRQSRAQASSQALQEAFVRVLLDVGYEKTTVREVVAVAGVGVGTFYEYFGNMQALAALVVHQHVKALAQQARAAARGSAGLPLAQVVAGQLHAQVAPVLQQAPLWAQLFALERQVSTRDAFARQYEAWVELWRVALASAADPPLDAASAARMLHSMTYGSVSQALLSRGGGGGAGGGAGPDRDRLWAELQRAAQAYAAVLARQPISSENSH